MTIRKGHEWGTEVDRPTDLLVASSDTELARLLALDAVPPLAVGGGDVHRSLGSPTAGPRVRRVDMDALRVDADGEVMVAVAHVVARRSWWRGPIVGVFNVEHRGSWDVAPRGHPNDGRAEIVEVDASMGVRARLQAWRRLPTGTHLPHPAIHVASRPDDRWDFERPMHLCVDGRRLGSVSELRVTVVPDAYALHI
jgi:hypothetical protein